MGQNATIGSRAAGRAARLGALLALSVAVLPAQLEWRRAGTTVIDAGLAAPAAGAVDRVWFAAGGERLLARSSSGRVFETADFETWTKVDDAAPPPAQVADLAPGAVRPEANARARGSAAGSTARVYAFGEAVYRSDDQGQSWRNVSDFDGESIVGGGFTDLAVSPRDADDIVAANRFGVWRSLDGGLSWAGLNDTLPNLPVRRLFQSGTHLRIALDNGVEAVWLPGQREAWRPEQAEFGRNEMAARTTLTARTGARVTAMAGAGDFLYAGADGGRIFVSADRGITWRMQPLFSPAGEAAAVTAMFVPADDPRVALATAGSRVYRTFNGGLFWDDITANLTAAGELRGVTADVASGAVYVAARGGVFLTYVDLRGAAQVEPWSRLPGLPANAPAWDAKLDEGGHQLFVALDGEGVFATLAPHRLRDPRVVNAADRSVRAAAPGSLLSVIGEAVGAARVGGLDAPVLSASGNESQIQVPFEIAPGSALLSLGSTAASRQVPLPVAAASPAIFLDRDGSPMLLDADRGVLLEPGAYARAGSRLQILATGLGRVVPRWPTGTPAPAENTPRVAATVRVFVDRVPVEVTRATLAPGFVGFYLVEIVLPDTVNNGPAELYIEAAGLSSGRVSIQLVQ